MLKYFFLFYFSFFLSDLWSQEGYAVLHGTITELGSEETLPGVNVYLKSNRLLGVISNDYGFYSIKLPLGKNTLVFSYIGYQTKEIDVVLSRDTVLNITLNSGLLLEEITIKAEDIKKNVNENSMGTHEVSIEQIEKIPALLGEVDILKALQLLPGISSATEGASGMYVRGGGADQNLVLLDEAVVYNTGHMLGFFSVFNSDAIKNTKLIKGSMPAEYGSRISSVIDVQMKEGNKEKYVIEGGVGLISSRLTVQGPIEKTKSSFVVSARRTYALDLAQPFINKTNFAGTNYYFYDYNLKINYSVSKKDRVYLSGYFGRDVFKFSNQDRAFDVNLPYGNSTLTFRWNRILSQSVFSNLSLIYNDYNFGFKAGQEEFRFSVNSGVRDYSMKYDIDYYLRSNLKLKSGFRYTYHKLTPNIVSATNGEVDFSSPFLSKYGHEIELYSSGDIKLPRNIGLNVGMRLSGFVFVGPYTNPETNKQYDTGQYVKHYIIPEPRIIFNFPVASSSSIKGGVSLTSQNIHLVSNSGSTLPTDIWVPSSARTKPQIALQYSLGFFQNLFDDQIEASVEIYYKQLYNQLDYRESYVEMFSSDIENEFVYGRGRAYGAEFFIQKRKGRLTGWIGYTLSRTERWFQDIEAGRIYPAVFDRPHDVSIVQSFQINKSWSASATFVYASGRAYTPIQSLFIIDGRPNVEYGPRNSGRIDDYHRLDVSLIYEKPIQKAKKFHSSWAFSIYNIYNRRNPFFIYTDVNSSVLSGNGGAQAVKVSLFPIIPSVTWNFKWASK